MVGKVGVEPTRLLRHMLLSFVQTVLTGSQLYGVPVQIRELGFRVVPSGSTPVAVRRSRRD
jgi:hypothetical protein